jgi:uncharacterized membrane protein YphA (DoxX/SURF4 family)
LTTKTKYTILTRLIASVWLINGLFCKVLDMVPRHREIVAAILGEESASTFTVLIGISEIIMCIWILSGYYSRFNAFVQISIVAIMNILEFILVPELLLWGKLNSVFAFIFILLVYYKEFVLNKKLTATTNQ